MRYSRCSALVGGVFMVGLIGLGLMARAEETAVAPAETAQAAPVETPTPVATAAPVEPAPTAVPAASYEAPASELSELTLFSDVKITVASQEAETLREAPVITTVITGEEIARMGARTLNDVLLTVPGFSRVQDHNEYYSAERGIYASSQQKILVLRDGHRLNSRAYNEANFGPAIGLGNIKRIEVMRGPGATLYGDVALTAVINIVTKDGSDLDGGTVTVGAGDYGQKKAEIVAGEKLGEDHDILFFASLYEALGEQRAVPAAQDYSSNPQDGSAILGRFKDSQPAYDLGFKYRNRDWVVEYSHRYDHYTMPRAGGGGYGQLIDIEDYPSYEGVGVGSSSEFEHFDLKYAPKVGDWTFTVRPYFDTFTFRDNEPQRRADEPTTATGTAKGYFMKWLERSYGVQAMAMLAYSDLLGRGNLLVGLQGEEMHLHDSWDIHTPDATHASTWVGAPQVLRPGKEDVYGLYAQVKHFILPEVLFNGGVRYDRKIRHNNSTTVEAVSPRAALIYLPSETWSARLSYGRSFVDSPYWYRYNQMGGGYSGGENLKPEFLDSAQFSLSLQANRELSQTFNFFYNRFTDVVFRNGASVYSNAGLVESHGAEYELNYKLADLLSVRANYTFQLLDNAVGFASRENYLENVPRHLGNLLVDFAPLALVDSNWGKNYLVFVQLNYVGEQYSRWGISQNFTGRNLNYTEPAVLLANAGININRFLLDSLTLRAHVYNVMDKDYRQGGSVNLPYEQPGRWFLAQLSYSW